MGTVDLNDLGVFVAIVETASFSRAAAQLGLPKSSVSRAITRLEEALGAPMLHRTTRHVAASTAGRVLYEKVRGEIGTLRRAVGELPELEDEPKGRLRITASLSFEMVFAEVVGQFVERYREVEVELRLTNDYVDVVAGGYDLAFRFATKQLQSSSLRMRRMHSNMAEIYAAPSYVARRGAPRTPADLDRHEWVVFKPAPMLRLEGGGPPVRVTTRGRIVCDDLGFVREAVLRGAGIGYLDPSYVAAELAAGKLVRLLPRWSIPLSHLYAIWPGGRKVPRKVSAFLELMDERLKSLPGR
jgi:DNA-binding transcriptional LysR family regulator